ncbi:MAG: shikimate dehydrogenase [Dehalococcoidia bacterium]|nr:shikimate dehydrogenase [Dehalococcoidia bacterium]
MTAFVGLIGHSVKHSVSAAFQQAALDHLGIDARYLVWDVPPESLKTKMAELRQPDHLGANVTIPHKEAVIPLLDEVEQMAGQIGAVNTIVNRRGRLEGLNTDSRGFLLALRREAGFDPSGRKAVLLGAGGAARAAAFVLLGNGIASLTLVNRDQGRAKALAGDLERGTRSDEQRRVTVMPWEAMELASALGGCDLIVNCTPIGTWGSTWEGQSPLESNMITDACLVFDLVYNPAETPLLAAARMAGARTLPGLPMLVYQGASSFQLWTGQEAPIDIMMAAARQALGLT